MSRLGDILLALAIVFIVSDPQGVVSAAAPALSGAVRQAERASGLDHLQVFIRRMF